MSEQVTSRYRPLVTQLARQLIEEYKCTTASEKGLVSMIAGAYGRWLELSSNFQSVAGIEYLSHEKAHWYTMMGKEVDRAFKQYQSGLLTLQTLKNPLAGASIRANNAYIGQNQQFNTAVQQPVTTAEGNPDGTTKQ
jgi:DNA-directed RNA polymerase beta' subunit